jgi:hypothetical protein
MITPDLDIAMPLLNPEDAMPDGLRFVTRERTRGRKAALLARDRREGIKPIMSD